MADRKNSDRLAHQLLLDAYGHQLDLVEDVDVNLLARTAEVSLHGGHFEDPDILTCLERDKRRIYFSEDATYKKLKYGVAHALGCLELNPELEVHIIRCSDIPEPGVKESEQEEGHDRFVAKLLLPEWNFRCHSDRILMGHRMWSCGILADFFIVPEIFVRIERGEV